MHETLPRRVITVDYRGRGLSDRDTNKANYTIAVEAQDVLNICTALDIHRAIFIGTSRGGLILHLIAGWRPDLLAGIVLNDIGPVLELAGLRHIQDYLGRAQVPASWQDAAAMLESAHSGDFPTLRDDDWREMALALYRDADGRPESDFDPAIAQALITADLAEPLPDMLRQFAAMSDTPLLVIRGENSRILSRKTVEEMMRRHPNARQILAHGQGHAPLLHLDGIAIELKQFADICG
jgi:pimeloyl-ACP methyl ester carboxylesterase